MVPVSSLDLIGRTAFKGTKTLNRIQSIVCDAAYRTSENLLICAPTGAGKTNVAMLCILQTIRQHMEGEVIKRDNFKIVYVAPMKVNSMKFSCICTAVVQKKSTDGALRQLTYVLLLS